jgi:hypothetical protein
MQQEIVQIPNYGWVPFPYFQHALIILIILGFFNYEKINYVLNKFMYEPIDKKIKNKTVTRTTKISIALIPIIIILYLDIKYSSFSMNNLGVTKLISNDNINTFLKLFGAYCIIQVAAQDIGLKTGDEQADFVKLPIFQFLMYGGASYALTQNRSMALIATLLYFQLKFFGSEGKTKDVCFE